MSEEHSMLTRIVGVEEHVGLPELLASLPEAAVIECGYQSREKPFGQYSLLDRLIDTEHRLEKLDAAGLTVQVLSYPLPGADLLPPRLGIGWAKDANAQIAQHVGAHPDRYVGLAHLPLTDPAAAAKELERAVTHLGFRGALVNGATGGLYLDHPSFEPLLARAEALDVPIYLHPAPSPKCAGSLVRWPSKGFQLLAISIWLWMARRRCCPSASDDALRCF